MTKIKIFPYELIGKDVKIVDCKNKSDEGVQGKVIDETKNTIKIKTKNKEVILLKNTITMKLLDSGRIIPGKAIMKRPEDRLQGK